VLRRRNPCSSAPLLFVCCPRTEILDAGIDDAALPRTALSRRNDSVTYVIAQPCVDVKDKACIEECPVDCIYEGKRSLYIHPDECVDCGACEPVCPVEAIFYEDDTPEEWKDYYKANVEFFDELGSPGGASKLGLIERDYPFIAELPPQNG
jgi:NAD-dependent dihydropyrimidine dehydrogenase PreA subunit